MQGSVGDQEPSTKHIRRVVKKTGDSPQKDESLSADRENNHGSYTLALGRMQGLGGADVLYIWSHAHQRLAVYVIRGDTLELLFSRNCAPDLMIDLSLGRMSPAVKTLKQWVEEGKKDGPEREKERKD